MFINEEFFLNAQTKTKILIVCDGIQEVLQSIEEDFGSQYLILIELTQRALTRVKWYKDQLDTISGFQRGKKINTYCVYIFLVVLSKKMPILSILKRTLYYLFWNFQHGS
jgi:hypothetical protein